MAAEEGATVPMTPPEEGAPGPSTPKMPGAEAEAEAPAAEAGDGDAGQKGGDEAAPAESKEDGDKAEEADKAQEDKWWENGGGDDKWWEKDGGDKKDEEWAKEGENSDEPDAKRRKTDDAEDAKDEEMQDAGEESKEEEKSKVPPPEERGPCVVLMIPVDAAEALQANDEKRLKDLCTTHGVSAIFEEEPTPEADAEAPAAATIDVGDEVECEKDGEWRPATVMGLSGEGDSVTVMVRWEADKSEGEVPRASVRCKGEGAEAEGSKEDEKKAEGEAEEEKKEEEAEEGPLQPDDVVEGKYGDKWFTAKVVSIEEDGPIKIKWDFDGSSEQVSRDDVRRPAKTPPEEEAKPVSMDFLKIGAEVEGKYGESWFKATVQGIGDENVRIKWGFDGSEERVAKANIREVQPEEPPPPPELRRLVIFGGTPRGRLEMELEVLCIAEGKAAGHLELNPRKAWEEEMAAEIGDLGWTVLPLVNEGEMKAKVIGKQGAVRKKITKACGSAMEILGNTAHIVGTAAQRAATAKVVETLQTITSGENLKDIPEELEPLTRVAHVPTAASKAVIGSARSVLNGIEEATGTITFFLAASSRAAKAGGAGQAKESQYTADMDVEGSVRGQWYKAKVVEQFLDEDDDVMVRIRWEEDGKEIDLPPNRVRACSGGNKLADLLAKAMPLAIIGFDDRARRLAELQVLNAIEASDEGKGFAATVLLAPAPAKEDGASGGAEEESTAKVDAEAMELKPEELEKCKEEASLARLRAIGVASRCIIGLVGEALYFLGPETERSSGKEFVRWWLSGSELEVDHREDVVKLVVPNQKLKNLPDSVKEKVEKETGTVIMMDDGAALTGIEDSSRLLVMGLDAEGRSKALAELERLQDVEVEEASWGNNDSWGGNDSWGDDKKGEDSKDDSWGDSKDWNEKKDWDDKKDDKKDWDSGKKSWEDSWDKKKDEKDDDSWGDNKSWEDKKDDKKGWDDSKKGWGDKDWDAKKQDSGDKWGAKSEDKSKSWGDSGGWGSKSKDDWGDNKKDDWADNKKGWGDKDTKDSWGKNDSWDKSSSGSSWDKKEEKSWGDDKKWGQGKDDWNSKSGSDDKSWDKSSNGGSWGGSNGGGAKRSWEGGSSSSSGGGYAAEASSAPARGGRAGAPSWAASSEAADEGGGAAKRARFNAFASAPIGGSVGGASGSARAPLSAPRPQPPARAPSASAYLGQGSAPDTRFASAGAAARGARSAAAPPWQQSAAPAARARPAVYAPPPAVEEDEVMEEEEADVDAGEEEQDLEALARIEAIGFPNSVGRWMEVQEQVWGGYPKLATGWIRIWSRTHGSAYYLRMKDQYTTFDLEEAMAKGRF